MKRFVSLVTYIFFFGIIYASNSYQEIADELFSLENYEKAFRTYGDAIKADPPESNNYMLYLKSGDCAIILGFKQLGINYYGIATQKGCSIKELCSHILNRICNGEKECLSQVLQTIIDRNPNANEALTFEIGKILSNTGKHEKAAEIFAKIAKEDTAFNLTAKKALAESLIRTGESEKAKRIYEEIIGVDANDFDANSFLGNYYFIVAQSCAANENTQNEEQIIVLCKKYYTSSLQYLSKAYSISSSEYILQTIKKVESSLEKEEKQWSKRK